MKSLPILVFLITGAIGWNVAGNLAPTAKSKDAATAAPSRSPKRPARTTRKSSGPGEAARQQMAAIRASRDPAVRMRSTVDLARSLSPSEFGAWMDGGWFDIRSGAELTLFSMIIRERWQLEDPDGLLAHAIETKTGQADGILRKWAETDPQRVLDFFKTHPNDSSEIRALSSLAAHHPALALQRLQEMTTAGIVINRNESNYTGEVLRELAKQSPAALEAALGSLPAAMRDQVEPLLIAAKMNSSFEDEFQKLKDRPDGMKLLNAILEDGDRNNNNGKAISEHLLADLSSLPASWRTMMSENPYRIINQENAAAWASADLEDAGFSKYQSDQIRARAMSSLYREPETAIRLLGEFDMDESNRHNVLSNIFGNLKDPGQAAGLIAKLNTEEDREYARSLTSSREQQVEQPKIDTPDAWLAAAAAIDPKTGRLSYQFSSTLNDWDSGKRADLVRQFQTLPDESKRAVAEGLARSGYSSQNPLQADAVRFLVSNPSTESEPEGSNNPKAAENRTSSLAVNYVSSLAQTDPTGAGEWIGTLPSGEPRLWAQKNLHGLWSQYDPQAADQWLATQSASDRAAIKELGKK